MYSQNVKVTKAQSIFIVIGSSPFEHAQAFYITIHHCHNVVFAKSFQV